MTVLSSRGLTCAFDRGPVLRDVSITVGPGEVVGLVGPNGAGKTTWLRCLAGLLPVAGEICYQGTPLAALSSRQRARRRAFVPHHGAVVFPYRVSDVVAMGLAHRSALFSPSRTDPGVEQVLGGLGFAPGGEQFFSALSGGEQQLALLARALVQAAPLLLLDEPTSALDLGHRAAVIGALRRQAAAGAAVLLSLHDLNLAALACDRLVMLAEGRVIVEGSPTEVLTAERLNAVYGVPVLVTELAGLGRPTVQLDPRAWS